LYLHENKHKKIKNDKGPSPVFFLVLLSFSLLLLAGCSSSPLSKGSVEGYVHEETVINTRPIEGALVSITGSTNIALTNEEGYFKIDEVSIGSRTLTIIKEGYPKYHLLNVSISEGQVNSINDGNPIIVQPCTDKYLFDGGVIYYNLEDYTNALTTFQQLLEDFPDSPYADDAKYYIAYINEKKFRYYSKALLEYYQLLINYPGSIWADDAQLGMGNCYYANGEYNNAIIEYQKVIDEYPDSPFHAFAQYYIGHSYRNSYNFTQAVIEFNKVIDNYPESNYVAPAQYYIAYSYYEDQKYSQAIIEFQKVIDNYSGSTWLGESDRLIAPLAQFYIGYCHGKLAQYPEAINTYQLVINNYSDSTWSDGRRISPDAQFRIGDNYRALESWPEARAAYQLVIDNYPGSTWYDGSSIPTSAQYWIDWIDINHPPS
jgi:TolA-binding protein